MIKEAIAAPPLKALGPYSLATETDGLVFISGQIRVDPATGKLVEGTIGDQTKQVFENLKAILSAAGLTFAHVIKATVFLVDMGDFAGMNEVYKTYMVEPFPARSTIQVAALPIGARVEIELVADRKAA